MPGMNTGTVLQSTLSMAGIKERLKASPIAHRLARGAFWNLIGTVLARTLSVVASIAVARMLGKVGFGELGIIQSTLLNLSVFTSHGLGLTAIKYISECKRTDPARAGRILVFSGVVASGAGLLFALVLIVTAPWFAEKILAAPHLTNLLRLGGLVVFFTAVNGAQNGALAGFEAFKRLAQTNLIVGLINFPLMVGGAWFGGLEGAVWGFVASNAVGWLITHRAVRLEAHRAGVPFSLQGIWTEFPVLKGYSLPALLSSVVYGPVGWVCNVMLVNQPDGYPQMAVFNATTQWFAMIMFIPALVSQVVLPMFSESIAKQDYEGSRKILRLSASVNTAVVVPLVALTSLISPWILALYGKGYADYWLTFVVALVTAGVLALVSPWAEVLNGGNLQWAMFGLNLSWGVASLISMALLSGWGALGLVSARLAAFVVKGGLTVVIANRMLGRMAASGGESGATVEMRS